MKNLKNNCKRGEIFISPKNYKSLKSKEDLKKNWFVQCKFYDPVFISQYPNGFQYRKKLNKFDDTIQSRKSFAEMVMAEMKHQLDELGYNPISKAYCNISSNELSPNTLFIKALELAYDKIEASPHHVKQIKHCLARLKPFFERLKYNDLKISEIKIWHIKNALDQAKLTPSVYNKFRAYLMSLFKELIQYGCIDHNPCRDLAKQKIVKTIRETLSNEKYQIVHDYIEENYPDFFRYFKIFFLSGARTSELLRLQKKDVNLALQEYKVIIRKGRQHTETIKVILPDAIPYWKEILSMCKSENDYLFSKGLVPSANPIQPYQITKRWYRLIKQSDKIKDENGNTIKVTEDFYALKHLFLDKLDEAKYSGITPIPDINLAKTAASHKTDAITKVYTVGKSKRENEALKHVRLGIG